MVHHINHVEIYHASTTMLLLDPYEASFITDSSAACRQVIALGAAVDGAFASIASTPVVGYITQHIFHYQRHHAEAALLRAVDGACLWWFAYLVVGACQSAHGHLWTVLQLRSNSCNRFFNSCDRWFSCTQIHC